MIRFTLPLKTNKIQPFQYTQQGRLKPYSGQVKKGGQQEPVYRKTVLVWVFYLEAFSVERSKHV